MFSFSLSAEVVQRIEVKGNDRFSKETIVVYGEITLEKNYSALDLNKVLKNLYETNFFEDIKISLNNGTLNITVKEYKIINAIIIEGEKSTQVKELVLSKLELKPKKSFIESQLSQDIDSIKKMYASMGFNFTDIDAKIKNFSNNRVNLVYFLKKGKKLI